MAAAPLPFEDGSDVAIRLRLLGGFELTHAGALVALPLAAQRLVAFLALASRPIERTLVAEVLWFDGSDRRAHASLRSTLWRVRQSAVPVIASSRDQLRLEHHVKTDIDDQAALARRLRQPGAVIPDTRAAIPLLEADLLPGWYDEWLLIERERLRQLRLHGLDAMCARLIEQSRYAEAIEVGVAAMRADPLRETTHRCLISAHLAEGNRAEAMRHYRLCCGMLHRKLGLDPSAELRTLVGIAARARDTKP